MSKREPEEPLRFWPLVGVASGAALLFALVYALLRTGLSLAAVSDSLCIAALILGIVSAIPFMLDAGRGMTLSGRMTTDKEQQTEALRTEHRRRELGMRFTFALALAAFLIGLASLLISLM